MTKVTKRDNYLELREMVLDCVADADTSDRLVAFIDHEIELMDKRNAKSRSTSANARANANDAIAENIIAVMAETEGEQLITDVMMKLNDTTLTASKISYRLNKLAEMGYLEKSFKNVKLEGETKGRKLIAYTWLGVPEDVVKEEE